MGACCFAGEVDTLVAEDMLLAAPGTLWLTGRLGEWEAEGK